MPVRMLASSAAPRFISSQAGTATKRVEKVTQAGAKNDLVRKRGADDGNRTRILSVGIKITAPLFSQLTKRLRKNQRACNAYRACSAWFAYTWGTFGGRFVLLHRVMKMRSIVIWNGRVDWDCFVAPMINHATRNRTRRSHLLLLRHSVDRVRTDGSCAFVTYATRAGDAPHYSPADFPARCAPHNERSYRVVERLLVGVNHRTNGTCAYWATIGEHLLVHPQNQFPRFEEVLSRAQRLPWWWTNNFPHRHLPVELILPKANP